MVVMVRMMEVMVIIIEVMVVMMEVMVMIIEVMVEIVFMVVVVMMMVVIVLRSYHVSSTVDKCFKYLSHLTLTITNFLTWSLATSKCSGGASVDLFIG